MAAVNDGLKRLYNQKLKPLEATYHFDDFASPLLVSESIYLLLVPSFPSQIYQFVPHFAFFHGKR